MYWSSGVHFAVYFAVYIVVYFAVFFAVFFAVPVVELVDVLDVSEHDVVLVVETSRDVL